MRFPLALFAVSCAFGQTAPPQTFALRDTAGLVTRNVKVEAAEYKGRKAVRLTMNNYNDGFAVLPGTDFQDGVIEADIALKLTTPPGVRNPGFIGIAFRARPDASHYDLFYLRPGNAGVDDQAMRNHSAQYVAQPGYDWYRLRREWPWVYEAHAEIQPETWTKVKIEVGGRTAKLYVGGSAEPTLVVDGLKGEDLRGAVALWGYANEESYFSSVRITPAPPLQVTNGSDIAGSWEVHCATDAGVLDGMLTLTREGNAVRGTWSGTLGKGSAVTGRWREGYVELSFPGEWPPRGMGEPGPVTAYLAGWVDGNQATGRMRVEGRSDGRWSAKRKN